MILKSKTRLSRLFNGKIWSYLRKATLHGHLQNSQKADQISGKHFQARFLEDP